MSSIVQYVARPAPKQSEIVNHVAAMIASGKLPPGSQIPSFSQIAEQFGTTLTTAQRAVHHLSKQGYIITKQGKGNFVVPNPPQLCHFGIVFTQSPTYSQYFKAWQAEAARLNTEDAAAPDGRRRRFSFFYPGDLSGIVPAYEKLLAEQQAHNLAGLVFTQNPWPFADTPLVKDPDLPRVAVSFWPVEGIRGVSLNTDELNDRYMAYLAARGRRRIAVILPNVAMQEIDSVVNSWLARAQRYGLVIKPHHVQAIGFDHAKWAANYAQVLMSANRDERPEGLVIADDNYIPYATAGIAAAGIRVPDDLDVVGYCNFPHPPPRAVPVKLMGLDIRRAVRTCIEIIERLRRGEDVPMNNLLPVCTDDDYPELDGELQRAASGCCKDAAAPD